MRRLIVSAFLCLAFAIGFTVCAWADVDDRIYPTAISIPESIEIDRNDVMTIRPELTPVNAETSLSWTSLDYSIAEIHSAGIGYSGNLIGINAGETVITVTTDNGLSASCTVTVKYRLDPVSIQIPEAYMLKKGDQWDIPITLTPTDASARFSIESSNPTVVEAVTTASNKGVRVYGKAPGEATVLVKTLSGLEATSLIIVEDAPDPESISIPESYEMHEGESWDIPITLLPTGVKTSFSISTTDSRVTRVATTGGHIGCRVIGGVRGTAVVTVSTENGLEAKCFVTVLGNQNDEDLPKPTFQINITPNENGTVSAEKLEAVEGDIISLTASPNDGYEMTSISVVDESGMNVDLSNMQFAMPAANVTVTAKFQKKYPISGELGDNLSWTLDEAGLLCITGSGQMLDFSVGSTEAWRWYANDITSIEINEGIINISKWAFSNCSNLTSVLLPSSLKWLDEASFIHCKKMHSISIPEGTVAIRDYAFQDCKTLTGLVIPTTVTTIGKYALSCSGLTEIRIPSSVESLGEGAFWADWELKDAYIAENITGISPRTFEDCRNLVSIMIPTGVVNIGRYAFDNCISLSRLALPHTIEAIEYGAFSNCPMLKDISYDGPLAKWNEIDFKDNNDQLEYANLQLLMPDFILPRALTSIDEDAFSGGAFTFVQLPDNAISIGSGAFSNCRNLRYIIIPESVDDIADTAFENGVTIIGVPGSTAYEYASAKKLQFIPIG